MAKNKINTKKALFSPSNPPKWQIEALIKGDPFLYTLEPREDLIFIFHPARALLNTFIEVRDHSRGYVAKDAFLKAEKIYMRTEFTDKEKAIAAAFYELGVAYDRALGLGWIDERNKGQSEGGKKSSPWMKYEPILIKHLKEYQERRYKNKAEVITSIENQIGKGLNLSEQTFNYWWRKYKKSLPLFMALDDLKKRSLASAKALKALQTVNN